VVARHRKQGATAIWQSTADKQRHGTKTAFRHYDHGRSEIPARGSQPRPIRRETDRQAKKRHGHHRLHRRQHPTGHRVTATKKTRGTTTSITPPAQAGARLGLTCHDHNLATYRRAQLCDANASSHGSRDTNNTSPTHLSGASRTPPTRSLTLCEQVTMLRCK